jgi:hypothetical protein
VNFFFMKDSNLFMNLISKEAAKLLSIDQ